MSEPRPRAVARAITPEESRRLTREWREAMMSGPMSLIDERNELARPPGFRVPVWLAAPVIALAVLAIFLVVVLTV
jgi:hypothetical protein